jgi:hypothetical protein
MKRRHSECGGAMIELVLLAPWLRHSREVTIPCSPKVTQHHRQLGSVLLAPLPG